MFWLAIVWKDPCSGLRNLEVDQSVLSRSDLHSSFTHAFELSYIMEINQVHGREASEINYIVLNRVMDLLDT